MVADNTESCRKLMWPAENVQFINFLKDNTIKVKSRNSFLEAELKAF